MDAGGCQEGNENLSAFFDEPLCAFFRADFQAAFPSADRHPLRTRAVDLFDHLFNGRIRSGFAFAADHDLAHSRR